MEEFRFEEIPLIQAWLNFLSLERGYSVHTVQTYWRCLKLFYVFLKEQKAEKKNCLQAFTPFHVTAPFLAEDVLNYLLYCHDQGYDPRSQRLFASAIKSYVGFCQQKQIAGYAELRLDSVLEGLHAGRLEQELPDLLPDAALSALLQGISAREQGLRTDDPSSFSEIGLRDFLMVSLFWYCGFRVSELIAIDLDGVWLEKGWIRVIGKRDKERHVPFPDFLEPYLREQWRRRSTNLQSEKYAIFLPNHRGQKLTRQGCWHILQDLGKRSGLDRVHPHRFRHTCATQLLQNGMHLRGVQTVLGHANVTTTELYTHIQPSYLKEVYEQCHPRAKKAKD